jgi:hypothetical protein
LASIYLGAAILYTGMLVLGILLLKVSMIFGILNIVLEVLTIKYRLDYVKALVSAFLCFLLHVCSSIVSAHSLVVFFQGELSAQDRDILLNEDGQKSDITVAANMHKSNLFPTPTFASL